MLDHTSQEEVENNPSNEENTSEEESNGEDESVENLSQSVLELSFDKQIMSNISENCEQVKESFQHYFGER